MLMFLFTESFSNTLLTYSWSVCVSDVSLVLREFGKLQVFVTDFGN